MKKIILCIMAFCFMSSSNAKQLVAYFSGTGTTQRVAEEIVRLTGADICRIEPADPYSANPYDDSNRIQDEAYNNRRPGVSNLPENLDDYDVIFIGSPIWWHYPAMVVCTFLEHYDLSGKIVIPFFTYGSTTYFQQSVNKIIEVTPESTHLTAFGSTGSTVRVENWLREIGQLGDITAISTAEAVEKPVMEVSMTDKTLHITADVGTTINIYDGNGTLMRRLSGSSSYTYVLPGHNVYLLSAANGKKRTTKKIAF